MARHVAVPTDDDVALSTSDDGCSLLVEDLCATQHHLLNERILATHVFAVFEPGLFHIVASPIGDSADALLRTLAGLEPLSVTSGVVSAGGLPSVAQVFRKQSGFVSRHSCAIVDATVAQNLEYSLRTRSGYVDIEGRVAETARLLHLEAQFVTPVSQLSRLSIHLLNIAMEVVMFPSFLFVCDPFSGLSCLDCSELATILARLAEQRSMVLLVSTTALELGVFEAAASCVLLGADGIMLYSGVRSTFSEYFCHVGVTADEAASGQCIMDRVTLWQVEGATQQFGKSFLESGVFADLKKKIEKASDSAQRCGLPVRDHLSPPQSWTLKLVFLLYHTARRTLLRVDFVLAWAAIFVSFLACAIFSHSQKADQNGMQNKRGTVFFMLSCMLHINALFVENEIIERHAFVYWRHNGYFSTLTYFFLSVVRLALPRLLFSFVTATCAHFIFKEGLPLAVLLGFTSFAHASIVWFLVYVTDRERVVFAVLVAYYAYCVMFCGFLINSLSVPNFFTAVSLLRPGYGGAVARELAHQGYSCDAATNANVTSYCYTGDQYLELQGFERDSLGANAMQLAFTSCVVLAMVLIRLLTVRPT